VQHGPWGARVVKHHSVPFLWCLLFGPVYFAAKGVWLHALIALLAALATMGLSWMVYHVLRQADRQSMTS
jgi:hypothetical protein